MDEDAFWAMIDARVSVSEALDVDVSALQAALQRLPLDEIAAFDAILQRRMRTSYTWSLWGAAYLINGGCSDDGFDYFRAWLIGQGRDIFERALSDPDSLADYCVIDNAGCEDMLSVAVRAYEVASGGGRMPWTPGYRPELGSRWDFEDAAEMKARYPRLHGKFAA